MADAKAVGTPFQKLAAALGAAGTEARGDAVEAFTLHRDAATIEVSLARGLTPCLVLRAQEEEAAPSSGLKKNLLARARARQVYPSLSIRRVTSLDRINTLFALRFEVRTGDAAFDRAVTIEGDPSDEVISRALGAKEARDAALEVLSGGFTIVFEEHAIRADLPSPGDGHLAAATVGRAASALATMVAHVPRMDGASFTKRPQAGRAIVAVIVATGLLAAAALAPGTLDDSGVPLVPLPKPILQVPTLLPGIAAGALAFVPAYLLLRWQIKRRNTWTDLPLVLAFFVAMAMLGVGALDASNRLLDDAPLAVHDVKVTGRETGKSRKSGLVNEWFVIVPSWREGGTALQLSIDAELYRAARTGDALRVSVHPGFFGWEWGAVVERVGGAPPPDPPGNPGPRGTAEPRGPAQGGQE